MNDITISKDTEDVIHGIFQLLKVITWRFGIDCGRLVMDVENEAEAERLEQDEVNELIVELSKSIFNFLKDMEDEYGGGFINLGPSKALSLMAQGKLDHIYLKTFFESHKAIINKLVILDSSRRGKQELERFGSICSEFSGKKRRVAWALT